jgi:hypothetical protein
MGPLRRLTRVKWRTPKGLRSPPLPPTPQYSKNQADRQPGQVVEHISTLTPSLEGRHQQLGRLDGERESDRGGYQDGLCSRSSDQANCDPERNKQEDIEACVVEVQKLGQRRESHPGEVACPADRRRIEVAVEWRQRRRHDDPEATTSAHATENRVWNTLARGRAVARPYTTNRAVPGRNQGRVVEAR